MLVHGLLLPIQMMCIWGFVRNNKLVQQQRPLLLLLVGMLHWLQLLPTGAALSSSPSSPSPPSQISSRRTMLQETATATAAVVAAAVPCASAEPAATSATAATTSSSTATRGMGPILVVDNCAATTAGRRRQQQTRTTAARNRRLEIPRVGYSLYKTPVEQVEECIALALRAGIRQFDCATDYRTNAAVGAALSSRHWTNPAPNDNNDSGRRDRGRILRRSDLFLTHKVSNTEQRQPQSIGEVQRAVLREMDHLRVTYLDLCLVHSPLMDRDRRLTAYRALCDLQRRGIVRHVGVCHYGVTPLGRDFCLAMLFVVFLAFVFWGFVLGILVRVRCVPQTHALSLFCDLPACFLCFSCTISHPLPRVATSPSSP
jgi:Aldo/keto reductase family